MKIAAAAIIASLSVPVVSAQTVGEMLSQLTPRRQSAPRSERFGAPRANVGYEFVDHDFVIPVAGNAEGGYGTHWKSEVVLSNFLSRPQPLRLTFFPFRGPGDKTPVTPKTATYVLPSYDEGGDLGFVSDDFLGYFGMTGLAAVLVEAVDSAGKPDTTAYIDGYSRIYTLQPNDPAAPCPPTNRGTMSQGMMTVAPDSLVGHEYPAFAVGLKQDDSYRTNVGIVNLSAKEVSWLVTVADTFKRETQFKVTVPGKAMTQVPVPTGPRGVLSIMFEIDESSIAASGALESQHTGDETLLWNAYASSVDNRSGDGWTRQAAP